MCGIAGFFQPEGLAGSAAQSDLAAMAAALAHRGPDGEGQWIDPDAGIGLCHRRLAIIDLSPLGAQPMSSGGGRYTISFNGEIYNYRELRAELSAAGFAFRSGSDTEVLLAAVEHWGVHGALQRCRAMLAFALWDEAERTLWLARDRFGEKPLYYGEFGAGAARTLIFGSELKALRQHSAWKAEVDRNALVSLLQRDFIPAPQTIFAGVRKLRPGSTLRAYAERGVLRCEEQQYWRPRPITISAAKASDTEALAAVDAALARSVRQQMVADVPLGAFLSGGVDSSLVVSYMQRAASQPVRTFSIGFEEETFNEAPFARRVAEHLGTQHTELTVTSRDALAVIPQLAQIYDEPFADSSQIPTYLVAQLARREVTVALSGDAGDELFGGYSRYLDVRDRWDRMRLAPTSFRRFTARTLESLPGWALAPISVASHMRGRRQVAERIRERARALGSRSLPELYDAMTSFWQPSAGVVLGASRWNESRAGSIGDGRDLTTDPLAHMMYADTCLYLPDDILVKVDRAAMAVSLETRVPLLDVDVAETAWSIPTATHFKDGRGKWLLRTLLERHVPRTLFDRPKSGFAIPLDRWLRRELREWADALLAPMRLRQEGYFDARHIVRRWEQHQRGEMNWSFHLWGVLMFQSWLEEFTRSCAPVRRASSSAVSESRRPAVCVSRQTRDGMGFMSRKRTQLY
jgi:asparagine synthase (glutamine-hydrolysing)